METFEITAGGQDMESGFIDVAGTKVYLPIGMKIDYYKESGLFSFRPNTIVNGGTHTERILSEIKKYCK